MTKPDKRQKPSAKDSRYHRVSEPVLMPKEGQRYVIHHGRHMERGISQNYLLTKQMAQRSATAALGTIEGGKSKLFQHDGGYWGFVPENGFTPLEQENGKSVPVEPTPVEAYAEGGHRASLPIKPLKDVRVVTPARDPDLAQRILRQQPDVSDAVVTIATGLTEAEVSAIRDSLKPRLTPEARAVLEQSIEAFRAELDKLQNFIQSL